MRRGQVSTSTGLLSIIGGVASVSGLVIVLVRTLGVSDVAVSLVSIAVALLTGIYSGYVARAARKLRVAPHVFLSYSHQDQQRAQEIAEALRENGVKVWLDIEQLRPGDQIHSLIEKAVDNADTFVALLSQTERANLAFELGLARAKGIKVIPVLLSDAAIPSDLQGVRYVDLRHDFPHGLAELVKAAS